MGKLGPWPAKDAYGPDGADGLRRASIFWARPPAGGRPFALSRVLSRDDCLDLLPGLLCADDADGSGDGGPEDSLGRDESDISDTTR